MRNKKVIAVICVVLVSMQGITSLAARHTNIWKTPFEENLLALNEESLVMSESSLTLAVGEEEQLEVTYRSEKVDQESIEWKSSDSDIVSVNRTGKITANKNGEAVITAKRNGDAVTCKVTVKTELKAIRLMPTELDLEEGKRASLSVICTPSNISSIPPITWSSDNEEVVEVDDRGNLTAKKQGTAIVTVQVGEFTKTSKITVKGEEIPVKSIQFENSSVELEVEESKLLELIYDPQNITNKNEVQWKTDDQTVVTVDKNGNITAAAVGTAVITAEVAGKQASCEVVVKEKTIPLESISFEEEELSLKEGETQKLEIVYDPEDTTTEKNVKWTSSNEEVVTVENGIIKAVGIGEAVITAEVNEKQAYCDVSVLKKSATDVKLQYETFDSENGWLDSVGEGETAGTDSFRVEGIRIRLNENVIGGGIRYAAYVQNIGWQTYVANGVQAGITGRDLRLEAIKIKLTGAIASKYDIYYRTNIDGEGWLGWAKNGEESGSIGLEKEMLAMQVVLVEKGQSGPSNKDA